MESLTPRYIKIDNSDNSGPQKSDVCVGLWNPTNPYTDQQILPNDIIRIVSTDGEVVLFKTSDDPNSRGFEEGILFETRSLAEIFRDRSHPTLKIHPEFNGA